MRSPPRSPLPCFSIGTPSISRGRAPRRTSRLPSARHRASLDFRIPPPCRLASGVGRWRSLARHGRAEAVRSIVSERAGFVCWQATRTRRPAGSRPRSSGAASSSGRAWPRRAPLGRRRPSDRGELARRVDSRDAASAARAARGRRRGERRRRHRPLVRRLSPRPSRGAVARPHAELMAAPLAATNAPARGAPHST